VHRSRLDSCTTCYLTVDVEDWFHILDCPQTPTLAKWDFLQSRFVANTEEILELLNAKGIHATFFWLGWCAQKAPRLVRRCLTEGHEIASHGYAHVLAYVAGRKAFTEDVRKGKCILEDITGKNVAGFRAPGFSMKDSMAWAFEEIRAAGHTYDSSIFPTRRGHGGMQLSILEPHVVQTEAGPLVEIPQSVVEIMGKRVSVFGGGYLRLAPLRLIRYGIRNICAAGRPPIIYVHPREIDPDHPRLPLGLVRRFKCYVNLHTTLTKLTYLCDNLKFRTLARLASEVAGTLRSGREYNGTYESM